MNTTNKIQVKTEENKETTEREKKHERVKKKEKMTKRKEEKNRKFSDGGYTVSCLSYHLNSFIIILSSQHLIMLTQPGG